MIASAVRTTCERLEMLGPPQSFGDKVYYGRSVCEARRLAVSGEKELLLANLH
jgi:hypothetical protein